MERPRADNYEPTDRYDMQPHPATADMIALTDALLERKAPDSPLTFVDIETTGEAYDVMDRIRRSSFRTLLARDDEQLALPPNDYYPTLDIRKDAGTLNGISVRAWGWDDAKYRYTDIDSEKPSSPRQFKEYVGELDKTRELNISFHYTIGRSTMIESLSMFGSTCNQHPPRLSSSIWLSDYAETGYEGHDGKSITDATPECIDEFLDTIAAIVEDNTSSA